MQEALENRGINHALNLVGNQHKYQIRAAIIIIIQYISPSLYFADLTWLDQSIAYNCNKEKNYRYGYEENPGYQVEFDCQQNYFSIWTQICVAGLIGAGLSSFISDYFGRKKAMLFSSTLTSLSILASWFVLSRISFIVFFKLIVLGIGGYVSVSITYLSEIGSERFARATSAIAFLVLAAGGFITAVLVDKTLFLYYIGIPIIISFVGFHFLDETPMFLYQNKETGKVLQTLEKMATVNNKLEALGANIPWNGVFLMKDNSEIRSVQRWNCLQILKHPKLKYRVLIYSLIRLFISLAFWASLSTIFTQLESQYTQMSVESLAEIIGSLVSLAVYTVPTRSLLKKSLFTALVTCFFLLVPIFSEHGGLMLIILTCIMKGCLAFIRGFIYNLGNELFPIEVRSQCNGLAEIIAQSGGLLVLVLSKHASISWLIIGVVGLVSLGLSVFLPQEEFATLEKSDEIELNLDEKNPKTDVQPLIANSIEYSF